MMNRDDASAAVVAVALGAIALCVEVGSATAYAAYMHNDVSTFIAAHPFDVLSVAVWYSAGNWLARHIRSILSVVALSYGLAMSGLVALLAEGGPFISTVQLAIVAGTVLAILVWVALQFFGDGGGGPPPWMQWGEAVWAMVLVSGVAVYFEYTQPDSWQISFASLLLAAAAAFVLGQIIMWRGFSQGPLGSVVDRLGPQPPMAREIGVGKAVRRDLAGDAGVTASVRDS